MDRTERKARAEDLRDAFDLTKAAGRKFGGYSKGMKRRLTIAAGNILRPHTLLLGERCLASQAEHARLAGS